MVLVYILIASILESIASFAGGALAIFSVEKRERFVHLLISFAVGALLGVSFLELLPQAIEGFEAEGALAIALFGIILFFVLEKLLFWYHCHDGKCEVHTYTYLILWGDFVHNFIDGVIIALAFMVDTQLGMLTTAAVIFHEIPQEVADFGVLVHGGLAPKKALFYNFLISLSTILGAVLTYAFGATLEPFLPYALALIAGNFIYIASTDLMPELHEASDWKHSAGHIVLIALGIVMVSLPHLLF